MNIQQVNNSSQIINVIHRAFQRYQSDPMPSSALAETSGTINQNLCDGVEFFGSTINEQLVAVVKITRRQNALFFSRLSVLPEFQCKGIATALIAHIEQLASQQQLQCIICKVRKTEIDNIRLYKKLGYQIIQEEYTTSPTGFTMETVTMQKQTHTFVDPL